MNDHELLREYVGRRSQDAFRQLVGRHLPMVCAAARRTVRDAHLAEEVAQNVFTTLAQKADSLHPPLVIGGWLYHTTRHLAMHAVRTEQRRREREQTALTMQTLDLAADDPRIPDHLEPALAGLAAADRDALVLRYLENRSLREVGAELGLSEDAARMRVNRALERLRAGFERQGVVVTSVFLATAVTATTTAVSAGLATTISTTALALTATTLTHATIITMSWLNTKSAAAIIGAALLAGTGIHLIQEQRLSHANADFQSQLAQLRDEQVTPPATVTPPNPTPVSATEDSELLRLRGEVTVLRRERDDLLKQVASTAKSVLPPARREKIDTMWVEQVLNAPPKDQGAAAGVLRGKLLRNEMADVSSSEVALRDALLQRKLNQTLERSPVEFADFQTAFIQNALTISDAPKIQQIHALIRQTYEQAVANGLDIPSKPATETEAWVQQRFQLDRRSTAQLQQLLTPEERALFDRSFLGIMGVDLGGVGVDKSNYPGGFLGTN